MAFDKTEYQRAYQANQAAKGREITIGKIFDPIRRKNCLANPITFLKTYFPDSFYRPFSDDQREAIGVIVECAEQGADEMLCAPRGDWKTETVKHMVIFLVARKILRFPVLIGPTADAAGLSFEHIKKRFHSEIFAEDFPEIAGPILALNGSARKASMQTFNGRQTNLVWGAKYISLAELHDLPGTCANLGADIYGTGRPSDYGGVKLIYRGLEANIRGINIDGSRPDFALGDDLETRESAESDNQIQARETVLDKDVGGLAGDGEILPRVMVGTVQNEKCLTNKKLIEWGGKRYQAVKAWPTNEQGLEKWELYVETRKSEKRAGSKTFPKSHQIYIDNRDIMDEGAVLGNPHNYSRRKRKDGTPVELSGLQRVYNLIADRGINYVLTELQNDPPKSASHQTMGLTYHRVMTRISGFKQREIPPDTMFTTAAIDLGKYACHWEIKAWREGLAGITTNYGVAEVNGIGTQSDQAHVDAAILRTLHQWRQELLGGDLCEVMPNNILIDSGTPIQGNGSQKDGQHSQVVYSFVKSVQDGTSRFKASKGLTPYGSYKAIKDQQIVGRHWHARAKPEHGIWLYNLDTDQLKHLVHQMWLTPTFDDAQQMNQIAMSLFSVVDKDGKPDTQRHLSFAKHQVAEEFRQQFLAGKGMRTGWHKVNANNHWLDTSYMNLAAALMMGMWMPTSFDSPDEEQNESVEIPQNPTPINKDRKAERNNRTGKFSRGGNSFLARR